MKILVAIKHVADTATKIKLDASGTVIDEAAVKWVISPYDEYALEQALLFREAGEGEVIVVCAGRESAQATLRQGLAMGADRAVLVQDARYDRCDALARSRALAAVARTEGADLVLVGKVGVGTDEAQTGPMLGELLDWPHVSAVCRLELQDRSFSATREIEGAQEVYAGQLPAVITCDKGLNEPRYASLKGIMQAKRKPLEVRTPADLELDTADLDAPRLVWEALELPPSRSAAKLVEGSADVAARELARLLRDEAKVI